MTAEAPRARGTPDGALPRCGIRCVATPPAPICNAALQAPIAPFAGRNAVGTVARRSPGSPVPHPSTGRTPPLTLRRLPTILGLAGLAAAAVLLFGTGVAAPEPAAIQQKRAQVERIQAELAAIDAEVERAAEAYNGARYQLGLIKVRIERNRRQIRGTEADLERSRAQLGARLRAIYVTPPPSLAEVVVSTGSIAAATDQLALLDAIGERDAGVVSTLRDSKARLEGLRVELLSDERRAAAAVDQAAAQKQKVESLLAQRQAVLDNVKGELREMIRAEQERKRRIAAAQKAALAAARAAGYSATALPSGGSNAGAVAVALQQLGTPYVWGGAAPGGFDCSGLASYAFAQIGKSVPHYTGAIWSAFPHVASGTEEPGDMVFFNGGGHMGIYIGNGQFVHAPHTGDVVRIANLSDRGDYMGAVRA
jgi:peptidoglycan DL-endopeptidase CwlO